MCSSDLPVNVRFAGMTQMLDWHFRVRYPAGAPAEIQKRMNTRLGAVRRAWARELLLAGAPAQTAAAHIAAMNRYDRFNLRNTGVTLWWFLKKITANKPAKSEATK